MVIPGAMGVSKNVGIYSKSDLNIRTFFHTWLISGFATRVSGYFTPSRLLWYTCFILFRRLALRMSQPVFVTSVR